MARTHAPHKDTRHKQHHHTLLTFRRTCGKRFHVTSPNTQVVARRSRRELRRPGQTRLSVMSHTHTGTRKRTYERTFVIRARVQHTGNVRHDVQLVEDHEWKVLSCPTPRVTTLTRVKHGSRVRTVWSKQKARRRTTLIWSAATCNDRQPASHHWGVQSRCGHDHAAPASCS